MQTTNYILMIRPVNFNFNAETAVNNAFQVAGQNEKAQSRALEEFEQFVAKLKQNGIDVTVVNDSPQPYTPDSIFPNNWISMHEDGTVCLYPMYAPNRRLERKTGVLDTLKQKFSFTQTIDFSSHEKEHRFLEGTGSMVLDRDKKIAYACLSPRTDKSLFEEFCSTMRYKPVSFTATDSAGREIYHTNVMMCVADRYVVICLDAIPKAEERKNVEDAIRDSGKTIITISLDQMNHFAGNMLQVSNAKQETFLVMSTQAYESLLPDQIQQLNSFNPILHSSLTTIETNGGGSARCMMAEIHLPALT